MTAHVSMLLKSCALPDMLHFSLCNKKSLTIRHTNKPLFPTTQSISSYDIGNYVVRAKDLSIPLGVQLESQVRTYVQSLTFLFFTVQIWNYDGLQET
jgi:hypothetical protein